MISWLLEKLRALGTWLRARVGFGRGHWRHGEVKAQRARLFSAPLLGASTRGAWGYGVYAPGGLRDDDPAPLVMLLHGCRQNALGFAQASGWTRLAEARGFRLLCPDQNRIANLYRCWNWFHPWAQRGEGEVAVVLQTLDETVARLRTIDSARVVVGLSAGAGLASLLAFHHPLRFAAAVTVAAPPLLGQFSVQNPRTVMRSGLMLNPLGALGASATACAPIAIIQGGKDEVVNPRCAEQLLAQALEANRRGNRPAVAAAANAGAVATEINITDYRNQGALRVRRIDIAGLCHVWTGGPGGHPFCEAGGPPLANLALRFFDDIGVFAPVAAARA